ncbi:Cro/CI family transcriptional regulator [Xenorhabdus koppenhoeferi]|uniref:Cro protein n=1 Tax=Xenorhabdus koppenhoeferi TaxID=351659 RepID=A0A1I7EWV0_9GAMM|nr:Cro/CI family transcriptional regulator [Xenorhabdus koppenhoeferi]SFU28359.1 Cro protein [Xenorhabdus koppenhoeferi]
MEKIPLSEYVKLNGQAKTAGLVGVHQTAISKALRSGRKIFLIRQKDGTYKAEECRPFPSQKQAVLRVEEIEGI